LFPIWSIPYLRLARRVFSGAGSLASIAYEKEVLCPEESEAIAPAAFLPGQLDRVTQWRRDPWFGQPPISGQIADMISTSVHHPPTIAYHIKSAVLFEGSIYAGKYRYPLHPRIDNSVFMSSRHIPEHLDNGALASTYLGTKFFGHWLADDCTRYLLAEEVARVVCARRSAFEHEKEYQAYFGQNWAPIDCAYIDDLVVYEDSAQNSHKRKRYDVLRSRIRSNFPAITPGSCVYLKRGTTGTSRLIENEAEIIDTLTKRGFVVIDIGSDRLDHVIKTLLGASIVVSVEGSHNAHCIYTSETNSALLMLMPADRFSSTSRSWAACLGIRRYGFVVSSRSNAGYYFPIPDILRTIELINP
jgi:hypothetical protein